MQDRLASKITKLKGFTTKEAIFVYKALRLQDAISNSLEFKTLWLNERPSHNKGMRQSKIYELWMKGYSRFDEKYDFQIDYALFKYKKKKGTYASTSMRSGNIILNSIHFKYLMSIKHGHIYLSSSLAHECMHSQFGFLDRWPYKRKSVPYTMGNVHRHIGEMHIKDNRQLTPLNS